MKRLVAFLVAGLLAYATLQFQDFSSPGPSPTGDANTALEEAQTRQLSDVQLTGQGIVVKVLPDDLDGSRHQRYILDVGSGETVLVSHNIDLAPRVQNLRKGDSVIFFGEYEWNSKGGVVHWTHHDPSGRHPGGWVRHQGKTYQ